MASMEIWACDWHDADWSAGSGTHEDEARDKGWVVLMRREHRETVFPAIPGIRMEELRLPARWHEDYAHICNECVKDPECHAHYAGWKAEENAEAWEAAAAA